ncbi:MAG TPA: molybdopterin-dependent oxidoreductase [Nitrososphaeraceae archaeon]
MTAASTGLGAKRSFAAGVVAGALAIGISLLIRSLAGGPFLPELASQTLFALTPGEFESQAVENFGPLAKYSAFIAAIVINFILYGLFGIIAERIYTNSKWKGYIGKALQTSLVAYVILLIISVALIMTIQLRTSSTGVSIPSLALFLILPQLVFGFVYASFFRTRKALEKDQAETPYPQPRTTSRKDFLHLIIVSAVALPIIYFGLNRIFSGQGQEQKEEETSELLPLPKSRPIGFEDPMLEPLLTSEVTPTYLFYRIDINPIVPEVDAKSWNLTVKGLVDNPLTINYDEIRAMPSVEQYATLECVSNKIGGDLISTAMWKGVKLKDILDRAKVKTGAKYIAFRCSDGYDVGIPLEAGLMDGTILAYDMNLAPLNAKHGFPVRAIVPGLYGMMNPKWITEIELVDGVYEGYWQRNGWTNVADVHTGSTILIPGQAELRHRFRKLDEMPKIVPGQKAPIAGMAFGGDRGISKVEVSVDNGATWKSAVIKNPLSKYTWVLWTAGFTPSGNSNYKVIVRATDKAGQIQTAEFNEPFPDGATGYHTVDV